MSILNEYQKLQPEKKLTEMQGILIEHFLHPRRDLAIKAS